MIDAIPIAAVTGPSGSAPAQLALDDERAARVAERGRQHRARRRAAPRRGRRCRCRPAPPLRASPISIPASRVGVGRSASSKRSARKATTSGSAAIRIAASDERDALLAEADQRERDADLDDGEGDQPAQRQPAQRAGPDRDREQHQRGQRHARPGHEARREAVVDGDLDEQVRHAPDHRDGGEQRPAARPSRDRSERGGGHGGHHDHHQQRRLQEDRDARRRAGRRRARRARAPRRSRTPAWPPGPRAGRARAGRPRAALPCGSSRPPASTGPGGLDRDGGQADHQHGGPDGAHELIRGGGVARRSGWGATPPDGAGRRGTRRWPRSRGCPPG